MMKKYLYQTLCLAAALAMTACTQDELTDDTLPEGMYPLEIGSVTLSAEVSEQPWGADGPQTRVSENPDGNSSVWEVGDKFYVKFEGSDKVGTYRIVDAKGNVEAVTPVYWSSASTEQTIIAWYALIEEDMINVSNQEDKLAYVIRATKNARYNRDASVLLDFKHQLAKVRVYLRGTAYENNVTGVSLSYPASYSLRDGKVQALSATNDAIQMYKDESADYYEASVLPGQIATSGNPFTITLNDRKTVSVNLSAPLTLTEGRKHDVTLRLHKQGTTEIDLSRQASDYEINGDGTYYFTGSGSNGIKVTGGSPNIYLDDATVGVSSGPAINITGGMPTIHVVGTGSSAFSFNDTGIAVSNGATVTITGNSTADVLTANGGTSGMGNSGTAGAGIGSPINGTQGGNVIIRNVKVKATGGTIRAAGGGAGIGSSSNGKCGDITIENAVINAVGGYMSAAIGMGCNYQNFQSPSPSIGAITVTNSDVTAAAGMRAAAIGFSCSHTNMGSFTYCSGKITITTDNLDTFLSHLNLDQGSTDNCTLAQKVGKGQQVSNSPSTFQNTDNTDSWEGVEINGTAYPNGVD